MKRPNLIYVFFISGLIAWWTLAFWSTTKNHPIAVTTRSIQAPSNSEREELKKALGGDVEFIVKLMDEWDQETEALISQKVPAIKRFPQNKAMKVKDLIAQRFNYPAQKNAFLIDDAGRKIDLDGRYKRFLPQTYVAASFLLALLPPEQIVALPSHLREQKGLYDKALTDQIPLDIDRYNSEKLFLARPDIAFIAHYSNPATIQALSNQGIQLYTLKSPNGIKAISSELINVGKITGQESKAELLCLFMESAFLILDNRFASLNHHYRTRGQKLPTLLYLDYHHSFSVPTKKTLTGKLLERLYPWDVSLAYVKEKGLTRTWMVPIDNEQLINLDPDVLIIAAANPSELEEAIHNKNLLSALSAIKNQRFGIVDESIQHSPSQYIVLAHYDMIHILTFIR